MLSSSVISLVDGIPKTIALYKGFVTASGGGDILPPRWSVNKVGNSYTIIHNLNLVNLTDLIGSINLFNPPNSRYKIFPVSVTSNNFTVEVYNNNMPSNSNFTFLGFKF